MLDKPLPELSWLMFEWGLFLYLFLGSLVSIVFPLSDFLRSFLALPSWIILPYLVGRFIGEIFHLRHESKGIKRIGILSIFLGIYSIVVIGFLLELLSLNFVLKYLTIFLMALSFVYLTWKTVKRSFGKSSYQVISRSKVLILLSCILVSVVPAMISRFPLPFSYGTIETISIPMEQYQPTLRLVETGYMQLPRIYDSISLAFGFTLFGVDPLSLIWSSSFLMMAIFSTGLFLFAYGLSKSRGMGLLVATIGSFLNLYPFRDIPVLFRSNVFLYVLFPLGLYLVFENISRNEYGKKQVLAATVSLFILYSVFYFLKWDGSFWKIFVPSDLQYPNEWYSHVWLPMISVATVLSFPLLAFVSRHVWRSNIFLAENGTLLLILSFSMTSLMDQEDFLFVFFIFSFVLLYFLNRGAKFQLVSRFFAVLTMGFIMFQEFIYALPITSPISRILVPSFLSVLDIYPFSVRYSWLTQVANGMPVILLLSLGGLATFLSKKRVDLVALSMLSLALFLYFSPEQYTYRVFKQLSVFMAYIIGVGFITIFKLLTNNPVSSDDASKLLTRKRTRRHLFRALLFSFLGILLLTPSLVAPIYERYFVSTMSQPMISDFEYKTAIWLEHNTPENSVIVSDYATIQLLTPLANKLMLTQKSWQAAALSPYDQQTYWLIRNDTLMPLIGDEWSPSNQTNSTTGTSLQSLIQRMDISERNFADAAGISWQESQLLMILTDRTVKWVGQSGISAISSPSDDEINPMILDQLRSRKCALSFDGSDDYIEVPYSQSFSNLSSEFTLELWFRPSYLNTNNMLISREYDGKVTPFNFFIDSNGLLALSYYNGSWEGWNTQHTVINQAKWYHLALSYSLSGKFIKFYVDGEESAGYSDPVALPSNTAPLRIGRYQSLFANGLFYLVRIYDRALTQQEIHQNYENFQNPTTAGIAMWFSLDEGKGNTTQDKSSNLSQGYIYGSQWVFHNSNIGYSMELIYTDGDNKIFVFKLQQ